MLYFENDYCEGAHPAILQKLVETNFEKVSGYGTDPYCASAKEKIRAACACPEADVFFISGGTQANAVVIGSMLHRWEGVLAATTGHVAAHEAGAIEFTGHKVLSLPHTNGKVAAKDVENFCKTFYADANMDHLVFPGMVYISHPSEYGTLYTKAELEALSAVCHTYHMPLFMDGARLGYGLVSEGTDVTLADIARLTDVFYIGGTKVGALFGEAVVIMNPALKKDFRFIMKQRGGRMAKGRLLGIQFDALFTDDLYFRISRHADEMAYQIRDIFVSAGYPLLFDSPTNQQYPIMPDDELAELGKNFGYEYWERVDKTHSGVRFCASWATTQENVDALRAAVQALKK